MKLKAVLLLLFILLFLAGCNTQAAPAGTGSSGESANPTVATDPTWETDPFLSLLPKPEGEWSIIYTAPDRAGAQCLTTDIEVAKSLARLAQQSGFTKYGGEMEIESRIGTEDMTRYFFSGRSEDGHFVSIDYSCGYNDWETGEWVNAWNCTVWVTGLPISTNDTPPKGAVKNPEDWSANSFRAWLPEPPTQYWRGNRCKTDTMDHYAVYLDYVSVMDVVAYIEELHAAGFNIKEYWDPSIVNDEFEFSAYNAEGWSVHLQRTAKTDTGYPYTILRIWEPEGPSEAALTKKFKFSVLPEPPCQDWTCTSVGSGYKVLLHGMDFEDALAYVEKMRAVQVWYIRDTSDPVAETVDYMGLFSIPLSDGTKTSTDLWLIYDPTREDCPCVIYYQ